MFALQGRWFVGFEGEKREEGRAESGKDTAALKSPQTLGSIPVFHSRADVPARACTTRAHRWDAKKHCYTMRSRAEVQQEFLGRKAAGWHPCLFYCSTLYLPIKFRASHIHLLVSSHSYLPPLVSVKMSIARRFITLFAFARDRRLVLVLVLFVTGIYLNSWHLFDTNMAWQPPGRRLGLSVLEWLAAGELLFHWWLQGVYKCVCVGGIISSQLPDSKRRTLNTKCWSVTEHTQTRVTVNAQWHHTAPFLHGLYI